MAGVLANQLFPNWLITGLLLLLLIFLTHMTVKKALSLHRCEVQYKAEQKTARESPKSSSSGQDQSGKQPAAAAAAAAAADACEAGSSGKGASGSGGTGGQPATEAALREPRVSASLEVEQPPVSPAALRSF